MKLDCTKPTIVITGAWNPAIFQAGWCAEYLFGVPAGQQVRTASVLSAPPPKEIIYFDQVGISVSTARLELFANRIDQATTQRVENTLLKVLEALPHTPLGALGINFLFIEDDADDDLVDSFVTADSLRENYAINARELKTSIEAPPATLNFTRTLLGSTVQFNFNYHFESVKSLELPDAINGIIPTEHDHAKQLLRDVFAMPEDYELTNHDFPALVTNNPGNDDD